MLVNQVREREVGLSSHLADAAHRGGALLTAVGDSLVLADGARLLHCVDPLDPAATWEEFADLGRDRVVAVTSCADLNPQHSQLFVVTSACQLLSWTWRGPAAHSPSDTGWHSWQPENLETSPVAITSWSLGAGQQEQVIADSDDTLWTRHRSGWEGWSDWEYIGEIPDVVALDVQPTSDATVELYAVTEDGELKQMIRSTSPAGTMSWSNADVVATWPERALTSVSWPLPDEAEDQAVLLSSGEIQQRWRRTGTTDWSPWWSAPAPPLSDHVTALAAWARTDGRQAIAVLDSVGQLSLRVWSTEGGWHSWLPPVHVSGQLPTMAIPTSTVEDDTNQPTAALPTDDPHRIDAARAEEATVLFAGRKLLPLRAEDPAQIGPFKLQKRIGEGQPSTDKFVARDGRGYCFLKVLRPEASDDATRAFQRESAMARRVVDRHRLANFIEAHPGDDRQPPYLALSFEQGKHLGELCDGQPLPATDLQRLARSLLEALVELRDCGILHLDLKPSNVIMRNGNYPVVVDYGSAVPADTIEVLEAAFGTPAYAAPEFVHQRAVGATTDTYAWAAVLVSAASGSPPSREPDERTAQLAQLPAQLRELVATALAEEPVNRLTLDDAIKRLSTTQPFGGLGLGVRDRLPIEALTPVAGQPLQRLTVARLVKQLGELPAWQYRVGTGAAAVVGIVFGFILGVLLLQLVRLI